MHRVVGCPRCSDVLRVPTVEIPLDALRETALLDRKAIARQLDGVAESESPSEADADGKRDSRPEAPVFDPAEAVARDHGDTPQRPTYRRRRKKPWVPAVAAVVAVAAVAYAGVRAFSGPGPLRGAIRGEVLEISEASAALGLTAGPDRDRLVEALSDEPAAATVGVAEVRLTAVDDTVRVTASPVGDARLVRVDLTSDVNAAAWLSGESIRLHNATSARLSDATEELYGGPLDRTALKKFAEAEASLALVDGLGGCVLLGEGRQGLIPVGEPQPGVLLFFVPREVRQLELLPAAGQAGLLPREFAFQVTLP